MKNLNTNWQKTAVIAFAIFTFLFFTNSLAMAQEQPRKFKPGEFIETGGGITEEIIQCRGVGSNEECETQAYRDGEPYGTKTWSYANSLRAAVKRVEEAKEREAAKERFNNRQQNQNNNGGRNPSTIKTPPQNEQPDETADTGEGECSFEPPAPKYSNTDRFSANLAKRNIYDGYARYANGTGSAPLRVGVTFLSFTVGKSYTNTVINIPGRGAKRINDAAPPNATIYRVKSKHIVCEEYSDGVQRKQVTNDFDCFKNRDGEWVCGSGGDTPPKIIQLN